MNKIKFVIVGALVVFSSVVVAAGDPAAGKSKSTTCAACHGADGNSVIPIYPRLAGQHADYLVQALKDYKSGARSNPIMASMAAALSEQDIRDLAAYYASQTGLSTVQ